MHKEPFLQFDFLNFKTKKREQTTFKNPIEIFQTSNINEVKNILNKVELAVHNGYYAAGFLSYEAASAFLSVDLPLKNEYPLIWFGIFDSPTDYIPGVEQNFKVGDWTPSITHAEYNHAFEEIKNVLKTKETKQVNYTLQLNADFKGDSYAYYNALKKQQNADYNAYISFDDFKILSLSPELFFNLDESILILKPMKGTKKRGKSSFEDNNFKNQLRSSTKDKLENQLIVDLMIDELKAISLPQSIKLKKPFEIETFPTLFQMTSILEAKIKPQTSLTDIFSALFPCGSITGTPKVKTINFISQLENRNRQIYCGSIGFITPDNEATFNVPIRTVSIDTSKDQARYDVGGGITELSNAHDEYNEAFTKAEILKLTKNDFKLIETFGLYNGEYIAFDAHLNRLQSSANFFDFKLDLNQVKNKLKKVAESNPYLNIRVRLLLNNDGQINLTSVPLVTDTEIKKVNLAKKPIDKNNLFLYHKTTNRTVYDELKADSPGCFDIILWNEQNEITEFTIGNLVIEYENELITPPVISGLLPGTYREVLLKKQIIKEQIITKEMLINARDIWLINSVRKWVKVSLKKATP